jgi:subtilase family serine protease
VVVASRKHVVWCLVVLPALIATGVLSSTSSAGPVGAAAKSNAVVSIGSPPKLPRGAALLGSVSPKTHLAVLVALKPDDPASLSTAAAEVSTPGSPSYHHYLERGQFAEKFGADAKRVHDVVSVLEGLGLSPGRIPSDNLSIPISATAGTTEAAFHVTIDNYELPSHHDAYANKQAPSLPTSIAGYVQGVIGLDDLYPMAPGVTPGVEASPRAVSVHPGSAAALRPSLSVPTPCSQAVNTKVATGATLANAYGFTSFYGQGDEGAGTTVGLFELSDYSGSDIQTYQACYGTSTTVTEEYGNHSWWVGPPGFDDGTIEAESDIEDVISLAPQAKVIVYVTSNDSGDSESLYQLIADDDTTNVVSTSWGGCEPDTGSGTAQFENTIFEQMALQGQTVLAAAGDFGSTDCYPSSTILRVNDPAAQPYVTGVGGTQWGANWNNAPPNYAETTWNDGKGFYGGGGGGISEFWRMPTWQSAPGVPSSTPNASSSGVWCNAPKGYCREVPDVSALAGNPCYAIYGTVGGFGTNGFAKGWGAVCGTSLAAPLWASLVALVDTTTQSQYGRLGFANPLFYQNPQLFNDITTGNNNIEGGTDLHYIATPGYDMATGLGTPNGSTMCFLFDVCPAITGVTFTGSVADPTITVTGSGFGSAPPVFAAGCSASGNDYSGNGLYLTDNTHDWNAGQPGDCIGLNFSTYSNTQVVLTLGNYYDSSSSNTMLNDGDAFTVDVAGATYTGTVSGLRAAISGVQFSGPVPDPTITVTGSGFGSAPPSVAAACSASGNDYSGNSLYLTDNTHDWNAGKPGDCIGLGLFIYSNTEVVFDLGNYYDSSRSSTMLNDGDAFTVEVAGATYTGSVSGLQEKGFVGVNFSGSVPDPTITVAGWGFGPEPPSVAAGCSASGKDFTGNGLYLTDNTGDWNAGKPGDCIGLNVSTYSDKRVVFTLGNYYDSSSSSSMLKDGDTFSLGIAGMSWNTTVSGL